jgi:hypothetical protein
LLLPVTVHEEKKKNLTQLGGKGSFPSSIHADPCITSSSWFSHQKELNIDRDLQHKGKKTEKSRAGIRLPNEFPI